MKLFKNPEVKGEALISLSLSLAAVLGAVFIYPGVVPYLICVCLLMVTVHLYFLHRRYRKITALSENIDELLHGVDRIDFSSFKEGEIAVLSNEIDKMSVRLREQAALLEKDKLYLKDSLADISHQLRTPLTTLGLITHQLRDEELDADERFLLTGRSEIILARIHWLLDSLLKISRLESGVVAMGRERVQVAALADQLQATLAIPLELREQSLVLSIPEDTSFLGDFGWSLEAMENIVKNCIEHTPPGGTITLRAAENPLYTEIIVSDDGPGIAADDLPHLFERFYKGGGDANHFGIGLALAQMIVTRQKGRITAENDPSGGARFSLRFYKSPK